MVTQRKPLKRNGICHHCNPEQTTSKQTLDPPPAPKKTIVEKGEIVKHINNECSMHKAKTKEDWVEMVIHWEACK